MNRYREIIITVIVILFFGISTKILIEMDNKRIEYEQTLVTLDEFGHELSK
jgi:hypothetical protein